MTTGTRRDLARWGVPLVLVLAAALLVGLHVRAYTLVSPVDEMQHIGYLQAVPGVVVQGDLVDQGTLEEVACRGIDAPVTPPTCGEEPYQHREFPEAGYNTAYVHPPTYYAVTRLGATAVAGVTTDDSVVTDGRLVGAAWLGLGLVLAHAAGRRLGAGRLQLLGPLLLVAATPAVLVPSATVNPDAASMAVGALGLLCVVVWTQGTGRRRWALLVLAGVVAEVVKVQNLLVLLALAVFLLLGPLLQPAPPGGRRGPVVERVLAVAVMGLPALVVAAGWTLAVRLLAVAPASQIPMTAFFDVDRLRPEDVARQVGTLLTPLAGAVTPAAMTSPLTAAVVAVTATLLLAGVVASALFEADAASRALGLATAVVGLVGAPVLVGAVFLVQGQYFPIPARYALPLLPLMVVLLAARLGPRWSGWLVTGLGVTAVVATAVQLAVL